MHDLLENQPSKNELFQKRPMTFPPSTRTIPTKEIISARGFKLSRCLHLKNSYGEWEAAIRVLGFDSKA
jgi:hypothetical protein